MWSTTYQLENWIPKAKLELLVFKCITLLLFSKRFWSFLYWIFVDFGYPVVLRKIALTKFSQTRNNSYISVGCTLVYNMNWFTTQYEIIYFYNVPKFISKKTFFYPIHKFNMSLYRCFHYHIMKDEFYKVHLNFRHETIILHENL